ncbi:aminotransferase class I/II-fold pyridoxal phosphate-dependent enzyme [Clostridium sp. C105KSO13]|uniref:aminotransferase class I/II-fold pyridoxal phosphate-dependent enzyme n=1 Tax=Clostridium sp. C105KSO13 TaxID=1776045 RepID=UPI0007406B6D|nr:Arginine decarboxylase [Clostridium sp. C105KSO13]
MNLYEKLRNYNNTDYYGFHMPGHKRNENLMGCDFPYNIDITEIDGFDNLHHPEGIIKEAQNRAALLYHAQETSYLVNGSTVGILSAIMGSTVQGDKILISRNCHKSVYHAIFMNSLDPVYVYPRFYEEGDLNGPVEASDIDKLLSQNQNVRAVVITSPTYDGVLSDVKAITDVVHRRDIPLIVDEAHGAHLGFHPYFPENSNVCGADVVIHSLHKTLPSLTQTALIHMNGELADRKKIKRYLHMLQTSSPSYVLMASMDACIDLLSKRGREFFDEYTVMLNKMRDRLREMKHLSLIETKMYDKSKLVISVKGTAMNGHELYEKLLNQYHLQLEMAAGSYVVAMTSVGDSSKGMNRLTNALLEIDSLLDNRLGTGTATHTDKKIISRLNFSLPKLRKKYISAEVDELLNKNSGNEVVSLQWQNAEGYISAEYAYLYPPGIPLVVPGEEISREAVELISKYEILGFSIEGPEKKGRIGVLTDG